jgi:acid phosphatase
LILENIDPDPMMDWGLFVLRLISRKEPSVGESLKSRDAVAIAIGLLLIALMEEYAFAQLSKEVKWVTESVEYAAICTQTYRTAWQAVKEAARNEQRNWVVVLDIDETVLDNSLFEKELVLSHTPYSDSLWDKWVGRQAASAIPGAKAFLDSVHTLGPQAHVAFITNREVKHESATIENMRRLGLFRERDIMLTRSEKADTKAKRRQCLESGAGRCQAYGSLVIIALIGDQIRDVIPLANKDEAKTQREQKMPSESEWGKKYFLLPNPIYGDWEKDYQ